MPIYDKLQNPESLVRNHFEINLSKIYRKLRGPDKDKEEIKAKIQSLNDVFESSQFQNLVADDFKKNAEYYINRGIPHIGGHLHAVEKLYYRKFPEIYDAQKAGRFAKNARGLFSYLHPEIRKMRFSEANNYEEPSTTPRFRSKGFPSWLKSIV